MKIKSSHPCYPFFSPIATRPCKEAFCAEVITYRCRIDKLFIILRLESDHILFNVQKWVEKASMQIKNLTSLYNWIVVGGLSLNWQKVLCVLFYFCFSHYFCFWLLTYLYTVTIHGYYGYPGPAVVVSWL